MQVGIIGVVVVLQFRLTRMGVVEFRMGQQGQAEFSQDRRDAVEFLHRGFRKFVPITYPGVKLGEERLRLNVTRGHTREDMDLALGLLADYGEAFFVLSGEDLGPIEPDDEA